MATAAGIALSVAAAFMAMLSMNAAAAQSLEAPLDVELQAYKLTFEPSPLTVEVSWRYPDSQSGDVNFEVERGFFAYLQPQSEVQFFPLEDAVIVQDGTKFLFVDVDAWDIETPCYRVRAVSGEVHSEYVTECFMEPPHTGGPDLTPVAPVTGSGLKTDREVLPFAGDRALLSTLFGGSTLGLLCAFLFVRKARTTTGR